MAHSDPDPNGGVKVFEASTKRELPLDGLKTRVSAGDTVRVVTPPPKPCADALQKEANTNCRDYAIVPGATPAADRKKRGYKPKFDDLMEDYYTARPQTIVIKNQAMMTLDGFLGGIATSDEFIHPNALVPMMTAVRDGFGLTGYVAATPT